MILHLFIVLAQNMETLMLFRNSLSLKTYWRQHMTSCNSISLPSVDLAVWSEEQGKDKILNTVINWVQQGKPQRSAASESEK